MQQNSLRWLAGKYLNETIQSGSHDSKEDAVTALRLVKLKLKHGPFFGKSSLADMQNLVDVLHEQGRYVSTAPTILYTLCKYTTMLVLFVMTAFW